jgi:monoamine oxidase
VKGGTQQISTRLLDSIFKASNVKTIDEVIQLNTALVRIEQNENDETSLVSVKTRNTKTGNERTFKAKKIISSIPVNQYFKVSFEPELPNYKRNFFKYFVADNYIKYIVTYKTPFWRDNGFSGEGTSDGSVIWLDQQKLDEFYKKERNGLTYNKSMPTTSAVAEVFDGTNSDDEPALVGFVAGKSVMEWSDVDDDLRRTEIIEDLVRMFGPQARDYVDYTDKNWQYEDFNGGWFVKYSFFQFLFKLKF